MIKLLEVNAPVPPLINVRKYCKDLDKVEKIGKKSRKLVALNPGSREYDKQKKSRNYKQNEEERKRRERGEVNKHCESN